MRGQTLALHSSQTGFSTIRVGKTSKRQDTYVCCRMPAVPCLYIYPSANKFTFSELSAFNVCCSSFGWYKRTTLIASVCRENYVKNWAAQTRLYTVYTSKGLEASKHAQSYGLEESLVFRVYIRPFRTASLCILRAKQHVATHIIEELKGELAKPK